MKSTILFLYVLLITGTGSYAQMTLAHSFSKPNETQAEIVNLGISGKKIMTITQQDSPNLPDTLYFYNMDYSFWKSIPCPGISGYTGYFNILHDQGMDKGVFYPSETLFNLDAYLEVAIFYQAPGYNTSKYLIINETGAIVDSIIHVNHNFPLQVFKVDSLGIGFQAVVSSATGIDIYNLPGTLPCDACENNYGLAYEQGVLGIDQNSKSGITTLPLPNPSADHVKITFTLPEGVKKGELELYNAEGQKIKTFQVDNQFGYVLLDNSQLSSGIYYYNIVANGGISATQKLVVIR